MTDNFIKPAWYNDYIPEEIVIFITKNCNLNCNYCYVKDKHTESDKPNSTKINNTLKFLLDNNKEIKKITFTGGEPLMYFEELKCIVNFLKNYNSKIEIRINTNAVLLDEIKLKYLEEKEIILNISIDGNKEIHDKNRVHLNPKISTYTQIMKNLNLEKNNISTNINVTVVLNPGYKHLFDNIKNLYNLGFKNYNIQVNFNANWSRYALKEIKLEMLNLVNMFIINYNEFRNIKFLNILRVLNSLNNKNPKICNYLTVGNDGNINSCYMEKIPVMDYANLNLIKDVYKAKNDTLMIIKKDFLLIVIILIRKKLLQLILIFVTLLIYFLIFFFI